MRSRIAPGLCLLVLSLPLLADTPSDKKAAEEAAMMQAMMAAATPGDAHKALEKFAGTWDATVKYFAAPGAPPMTSSGTAESRWVLGGRYLEQRFTGSMMGAPFEGLGYTGYDNFKKRYWGMWIDNMSTGVMLSTGKGGDGKSYSFTGSYPNVMTGKEEPFEEKITVVSDDQHVFEMWGPGPDGKNFRMMEITYNRRK